MRASDQQIGRQNPGLDIEGLERQTIASSNSNFGLGNWAVVAHPGFYQHVGLGFSFQPTGVVRRSASDSDRWGSFLSIQKRIFGTARFKDIKELNRFLSVAFVSGKLKVDIDRIIGMGLNEYFVSEFQRL